MFFPRPRALLVDVGFTLTSYDGAQIAAIAAETKVFVSPARLDGTERQVRAELAQHSWPVRPGSSAPASGGVQFFRRVLELAGASGGPGSLDDAAALIWQRHLRRNLWSRVLDGVSDSLPRLRSAGLRLAVVSNSEGTVEALLDETGLRPHFEIVLDSWVVGVSKPDPRIFRRALDHLGVPAAAAVMVGDSPSADVAGAAAAGVRGALLDPYGLHPSAEAPRFASFGAFTAAVLAAPVE